MNTPSVDLTADLPTDRSSGELPVAWYVHKHRREHEAAYWDERRVRVQDESSATAFIEPQLLIKFISCVIALTATLGIIVTLVR
jgi:hypothetical protein